MIETLPAVSGGERKKPSVKVSPFVLDRMDRSVNSFYTQGLVGKSPSVTLLVTLGAVIWRDKSDFDVQALSPTGLAGL